MPAGKRDTVERTGDPEQRTELREQRPTAGAVVRSTLQDVERGLAGLGETLYRSFSPWEKAEIVLHPERPRGQDYVRNLFEDVVVMHGDRRHGDDAAILTVLGTIEGRRCAVTAHRKGRGARGLGVHVFGRMHPEAFRKSCRVMHLAARYGLPVVSFVDTRGPYADIEAEERGGAWAIARTLAVLSALPVPVVVVAVGEGGSAAGLAIGVGDRLIVLEHASYSGVEPKPTPVAGAPGRRGVSPLMRTTDLGDLGLVYEVLPEPLGGAHREPGVVYAVVREAVVHALDSLAAVPAETLRERRYERLRRSGPVCGE